MIVLVVDDSSMVRQQVGRALVGAGFTIVEAADGVDALEKIGGVPRDEARRLRREHAADERHRVPREPRGEGLGAPVVMLTTEGQPDLIRRAKALGAKGWIVKPFKADLLVDAAASASRPPRHERRERAPRARGRPERRRGRAGVGHPNAPAGRFLGADGRRREGRRRRSSGATPPRSSLLAWPRRRRRRPRSRRARLRRHRAAQHRRAARSRTPGGADIQPALGAGVERRPLPAVRRRGARRAAAVAPAGTLGCAARAAAEPRAGST